MEDIPVFKDLIARLTDICRAALPSFKAFYEGDPIDIPLVNLPCVIVEKINSRVTVVGAPTGNDNVIDVISIRLVLNKADDFGAKTDDFDMTERKLRRYVEARDPSTGTYHADSLMYALRKHITLDQAIYNNDVEINYDINPRPNQIVTSEAQVTVTALGHIPVLQRD